MQIATWNVNSLRVRLPQVIDWLRATRPDVLAMQETKCEDDKFPAAELAGLGYTSAFSGQKTYNGVATLTRAPGRDVCLALPGADDAQRRVLALTVGDLRVVNVYVPNGERVGSEKYAYKLAWLERLRGFIAEELARYPRLVLLGDFNIAPEPRDVHDPAQWAGQVLFSEPEREALQRVLAAGVIDSFRLFEQPEREFSWWDYRMGAFRRNLGLRIDHVLVSQALRDQCRACRIDKAPRRLERPSDHAPVIAELALA
ncbi:MAG: exodeoxyribonuclease III [Deltaproteobacteria bacterium]|nr:exodeoxyribonuclease III [Deltaproteobacteria bacterium]